MVDSVVLLKKALLILFIVLIVVCYILNPTYKNVVITYVDCRKLSIRFTMKEGPLAISKDLPQQASN